MANEITEIGQIVTYGGPTIDLAGSSIASAIVSLQAREGSGSARGWRLFDPTKQPFLNSKKQLVDGDVVLVVAKQLPMDFPVKVTATTTSIPVGLLVPAGSGTTPFEQSVVLQTYMLTYTSAVLTNTSTGATESGTVTFRLDSGTTVLDFAAFNAEVAAIPIDEIKSGQHTYSIVVSVPSNSECDLLIYN